MNRFVNTLKRRARAAARWLRRLFQYTAAERRQIRRIEEAQRALLRDPAYMDAVNAAIDKKTREFYESKLNRHETV